MLTHVVFMAVAAIITFGFLLLLIRWIGETQVSQATYFNWVAGACMGNIAANMLSANTWATIWQSAVELAMFAGVTVLAAFFALKSKHFRSLTSGVPILLVHKGEFVFEHMKRGKINQDLLKQMLREQGYFDYQQIETAILEPTGSLSVLPKSTQNNAESDDSKASNQESSVKSRKESPHIK